MRRERSWAKRIGIWRWNNEASFALPSGLDLCVTMRKRLAGRERREKRKREQREKESQVVSVLLLLSSSLFPFLSQCLSSNIVPSKLSGGLAL